jgi:hypothetical protein
MRRSHVVLDLHVILKSDPFVSHFHLAAPGTDAKKILKKTQPPKNPERRYHHCCANEQRGDRLEPEFLGRPWRFEEPKKRNGTSTYSSSQVTRYIPKPISSIADPFS